MKGNREQLTNYWFTVHMFWKNFVEYNKESIFNPVKYTSGVRKPEVYCFTIFNILTLHYRELWLWLLYVLGFYCVMFWTCKLMWWSCVPLWWAPWGWQLVVETYVGVFHVHYICTLSSAFVGCYGDCDKMHPVYNIKYLHYYVSWNCIFISL